MKVLEQYIKNLNEGQKKAIHRIVKWGGLIIVSYAVFFLFRWLIGLFYPSLSMDQHFSGSVLDYIDIVISLFFTCAILYVGLSGFIMAISGRQKK